MWKTIFSQISKNLPLYSRERLLKEKESLLKKLHEEVDEKKALLKKLQEEMDEKEMHASSVRSLIKQRERLFEILEFVGRISKFENGNSLESILQQVRSTESQFYQDIIALLLTQGRSDCWFVEFGACDGMKISNTFTLEKGFGWQGIVAEPGRSWHSALKRNRSCHIDTRCVYGESGLEVPFYEAEENDQSSNIALHQDIERSNSYSVETISLNDLLEYYQAPTHIDFMSVDTEGTEYEILSAFPFDRYSFGFICVEHHLPEEEEAMKALMQKNGYKPIFRSISEFDGWYVNSDILKDKYTTSKL